MGQSLLQLSTHNSHLATQLQLLLSFHLTNTTPYMLNKDSALQDLVPPKALEEVLILKLISIIQVVLM